MSPLLPPGLDLRRGVAEVRQRFEDSLAQGLGKELLAEAAGREPLVLVELVLGPKAPGGLRAVEAALSQRTLLEDQVPPKALYGRLVELADASSVDLVVGAALAGHPVAPWAAALLGRAEEPARVLSGLADRDSFAATCESVAEAGLDEVLANTAASSGRPEPALALWRSGREGSGARAAVRAAERGGLVLLLPALMGGWGPDLEALLMAMLPHLRSRALANELAECARTESARLRLDMVAGALRHP